MATYLISEGEEVKRCVLCGGFMVFQCLEEDKTAKNAAF